MSDAPGAKRKREASAEDFQRLLARLNSDPNQAWQSYDVLRRKLVMFFEYHCRFQAEELAEEVLDRIAKKSESYEITNVAEFAFGVARNLRKEAIRKTPFVQMSNVEASQRGHSSQDPEEAIVSHIDSQKKLECFLQCMKRLDAEERKLLFEYYPLDDIELEERRLRLAEKHQINLSTLRTRMARLREKMEICFENCYSRRKPSRNVTKLRF